jgi:hypothetical protein
MNDKDSGRIVEILNNGFLILSDTLVDIKESIDGLDESVQMILRQMQKDYFES